MQEGTKV